MKIFNKKNAKRKVDYSKVINSLMKENEALRKRNKELVDLCGEKDSYFMDLMSDALRHGSSKATKHMADRREYLKKK